MSEMSMSLVESHFVYDTGIIAGYIILHKQLSSTAQTGHVVPNVKNATFNYVMMDVSPH